MSKYLRHELKGRHLTERERQVLALMAGGHLNKEIAEMLKVKEMTIKNHVTHILRKLDAKNRTHAVAMTLQREEQQKEEPKDAAVRYIPCPVDSTEH